MDENSNFRNSYNPIDLHINYEWATKVWWNKQYEQESPVDKIQQIIKWTNTLKCLKSENSNGDDLNDYTQDMLKLYTRELLCGEKIIEDVSSTITEHVENIDQMIKNQNTSRMNKKVNNVYQVVQKYFPDSFSPHLSLEDFNINLAIVIHEKIMENLIKNNGKLRVKDAKPAGEQLLYLNPIYIKQELDDLFKKTVQHAKKNSLDLDAMIKLSAQFLSRFLFIHPFSNGNGRTARILVTFLLSGVAVVPVSLYLNKNGRDIYLNCLRQSQENDCYDTKSLATFILDCVHKSIYDAIFALDLFD